MAETNVYILHVRDTKEGVTEKGIDPFLVRAFFAQNGITVKNVAPKASGDVFITCSGTSFEVEKLWSEYEASAVNPAAASVEKLVHLKGLLPKLKEGLASDKEVQQSLAAIVELALEAYRV